MSQLTDRYKRREKSGQFKMRPDKTIYWEETICDFEFDFSLREWCKKTVVVNELSPEQSPFRCAKTLDASVILIKEKESEDSLTGKIQLYYLRKMRLKVRPEFENVWLCMGKNNKIYIKDLFRTVTYCSDLTNDELCTAKKLSEKRISQQEASKIETGYLYSRYENDGSGNELFGRFCKPINSS